jgi:hypothetical protein
MKYFQYHIEIEYTLSYKCNNAPVYRQFNFQIVTIYDNIYV